MLNNWKDRVSGYVRGTIEHENFLLLDGQYDSEYIFYIARQRRETEYYQSARFFPREAGRYERPGRTHDPRYAERVASHQHYYKPTTDEERYRFAARREVVEEHGFYSGYDQPHSRRDYHRYPPAPPVTYPPVHPWGSTPYYQQYTNHDRGLYRPSPAELMREGGYTPSILAFHLCISCMPLVLQSYTLLSVVETEAQRQGVTRWEEEEEYVAAQAAEESTGRLGDVSRLTGEVEPEAYCYSRSF
ncbi:hypothetical protein BDZ89DRAFT_1116688, partial [Hymenopellis radicata]